MNIDLEQNQEPEWRKVRPNWWIYEDDLSLFKIKCLEAGIKTTQEAITEIMIRVGNGDIELYGDRP